MPQQSQPLNSVRLNLCSALIVLCTLCVITDPSAGADQPSTRPNLLLLLSDDHSYPFLSTYGNSSVRTPVLDQLAAEGMKFHRFFTGAPQCVPSRACLMTGKSAVAARMTRFSAPLPRSEISFPELLRSKAGYFTGICGRSFHLDGASNTSPVLRQIYEKYDLKSFDDRVDFLKTCADNEVPNQLSAFLDLKPADKPFFLWASFSDPHHPWNANPDLRPDPASLLLPPHWPDLPELRQQLADYFAEINRLDRTIGKVLEVLRQREVLDNTLIIFCGDNGAALPHGKGSLYDPGSNVPLLMRWPGVIKPGSESHALVSGEDLAPTLLAAAQIPALPEMTGVNQLPLLKGEPHTPRRFVFVERGSHGSRAPVRVDITSAGFDLGRAVRSDRYKLIYNCTPWVPYSPVDSAADPGWKAMQTASLASQLSNELQNTYFRTPRPVYELYDLQTDPSELNNLSGQAELAPVEKELREALTEKMILDVDFLPLPALLEDPPNPPSSAGPKRRKSGK